MAVEFLVLLFGDLGLRARPQGARRIELARFGSLVVTIDVELDREADVIGIGLDDGLDALGLEELLGLLAQLQGDHRAALRRLRIVDAKRFERELSRNRRIVHFQTSGAPARLEITSTSSATMKAE